MDNILTHPRFDRAKVEQPCPRRRRGTINLRLHRERRAYQRMCAEPTCNSTQSLARPDMVTIKVDGNIKAVRLLRALRTEGLALSGDCVVDRPLDDDLSHELRKVINELSDDEAAKVLARAKAIKAKREARP